MKTKRIHISWLIAALSAAYIAGTYLSLHVMRFYGIEWFVVGVCLLIVGLQRNRRLGLLLICLAGLLFGLWRGANVLLKQQQYEQYYASMVTVSGVVSEDPTYTIDGALRLRLKDVVIEARTQEGDLWVATSDEVAIKRSDIVVVSGQLAEGFGTIPATMYRADIQEVIRPDYADVARDVRDSFAAGIREAVQEPQASLGAGFLLGQKSALPEKLDTDLRLLGLTHIVVASGYNLTILVRFARRFTVKISRFTALVSSGGLVYGFALVTGWSPSMTRASIIAGLSLLAWYYGRKIHPFVLLSFSAGLTVAINPSYAWGDIGWLLSFASFVGVIIVAPLLLAYFWGDKKPNSVMQIVIETLSAQILTLPIIAYVFGQVSPLALPANVFILPLIPLAMLLTFIAGIGGLLSSGWLAQAFGWPAETVMRYMTTITDRLAESPLASREISVGVEAVIAAYMLFAAVMMFLARRTQYAFRDYNVIE